jgi:hypothetical protein
MSPITAISNTSTLNENIALSPVSEDTQSNTNSRLVRWKLQRTAQALLPNERVAFCMRRIQATTVDVCYSPTRQM